ncbi:uncharacterized protein LOC135214796 [Macrobrachium nipponense]|uniref:uncharacterized protein LOC135214796 n=1 Tax=Macrobrachium nipponense TaxID=159736 RepID=UPI0030C8A421
MQQKSFILISLALQIYVTQCLPITRKESVNSHGRASNRRLIFTHGANATLVPEGDSVFISYTKEEQICCRPDVAGLEDLADYQVSWHDKHGDMVESWNAERRVFSLGGEHLPHSYLVFTDFSESLSGPYTCVLWHRRAVRLLQATVYVEETFWEDVPQWLRIFF